MGPAIEEGKPFAEMLEAELRAIDMRRVAARFGPQAVPEGDAPSPASTDAEELARFDKTMRQQALSRNLVGLSLSGGGIRSRDVQPRRDPGTGPAAAPPTIRLSLDRLGRGLHRRLARRLAPPRRRAAPVPDEQTVVAVPLDAFDNVELQLDVSRVEQSRSTRPVSQDHPIIDEEPEAIHHLRSYSNYLTPRPGLFTADTWTILAIYLRNFLLNQLMLLPIAVAAVLAIWLLVLFYAPQSLAAASLAGHDPGDLVYRPAVARLLRHRAGAL